MADGHRSQAASNKALVERRFAAAIRGDRAAVDATQDEHYRLGLHYGHPAGGTFQGKEQIAAARATMMSLIGVSGLSLTEVIADGPNRVVAIVETTGTDAAGEPWSMPVVEVITVVDGAITETQLYFQDSARLRDIAREREPAA